MALVCLLVCGCAVNLPPVYEKDGKSYGWTGDMKEYFRDTWYDYYRCGLSYMNGEFYGEAAWAMTESLKRRGENNRRDRRMAKTYGMHFIDYFPFREKGIAYYYQGQYDDARRELERSIASYPSEKAFLYLDRVRKKIMDAEQRPLSTPILDVEFPSARTDAAGLMWTRDEQMPVVMRAEDPQYVSEIRLRGQPVFIEKSAQSVTAGESLRLEEGKQVVRVTARNLRGGSADRKFEMRVDRTAPVMTVEAIQPGVLLQGYLYDASGKLQLFADGQPVPVPDGEDVAFQIPPALCFGGVELVASDPAGNRTRMVVSRNMAASRLCLLASNSKSVGNDAAIPGGQPVPAIHLPGWRDGDTVFRENAEIEIHVRSRNRIAHVTVNGQVIPGRKGHALSFVRSVALKMGSNPVVVVVTDENGGTAEQTLEIVRKIPEAFQLKHRYGFTVFQFDQSETCNASARIYELFLSDILARHRFQVGLDRGLISFLSPHSPAMTSESGNTDRAILMGGIYQTRHGVEVAARLVETASSRILAAIDGYTENILAAVDGYTENTGQGGPESLSAKLSERLHRRLPMMKGRVVRVDGKTLVVEPENRMPGPQTFRSGWPVVIWQASESGDPRHGERAAVVGEAVLEKGDASEPVRAILQKGQCSASENYHVITR
ncbi:hypothetical protein DENIS_0303 [Desulfonema ishimotonii]|uniref:Cadherin-like beta-sandwich-like domain-containing protein n=1 Tax=Desulfonema ishimotonii TaxID=45657 RepID=A0A401FQY0_9BACT|nr:hypothetical protein DENIS_0303 [Desulfonema ishimotonii]